MGRKLQRKTVFTYLQHFLDWLYRGKRKCYHDNICVLASLSFLTHVSITVLVMCFFFFLLFGYSRDRKICKKIKKIQNICLNLDWKKKYIYIHSFGGNLWMCIPLACYLLIIIKDTQFIFFHLSEYICLRVEVLIMHLFSIQSNSNRVSWSRLHQLFVCSELGGKRCELSVRWLHHPKKSSYIEVVLHFKCCCISWA